MIVSCLFCGKQFKTIPAKIKDGRGKYCSRTCMAKSRIGTRSANWQGGPEKRACRTCGKFFEAPRDKIAVGKGIYCSRECYHESMRNRLEVKCATCGHIFLIFPSRRETAKYCSQACRAVAIRGKPLRPKLIHVCKVCGTNFATCPSRGKNEFCSRKCHHKFSRGKNHPSWRGGLTDPVRALRASEAYKDWRTAVFTHDKFTCQECGNSNNHNIHAHHVFPLKYYPEHALSIWNGITLCVDCHKKEHARGGKYLLGSRHLARTS